MKVAYANVRSLINKRDKLEQWIVVCNADIVALSETWLTSAIADFKITLLGYNSYRDDREERRGGGIVLYIKTELNDRLVGGYRTPDGKSEMVTCRITNGATNMVISAFYRSPNNKNTSWISKFKSITWNSGI